MYFNKWITGVQHVAVPTNDLEKTIEFYHSLGFTTALETYNEAAKHRAVFLQLGNLIIESYENGCAVGHPGAIDHIALNTTDIEATYALAEKRLEKFTVSCYRGTVPEHRGDTLKLHTLHQYNYRAGGKH